MKTTVLLPEHEALSATFTDFGGWQMPVRYGSELDEHRAVRTSAGLFDISHMAEIRVTGPQAAEFLDYALVNPSSAIAVTKAKYSLICAENGGVIDDLIVYRLGEEEFMVVANAGNRDVVAAEFSARAEQFAGATVVDESDDWALIAIQGPKAESILQQVCDQPLNEAKYYSILSANVGAVAVLIGRTGYTGEDGFEVFAPAGEARKIWQLLLAVGGPDLTPCGLACRDTLRLEAGMPLYGHELDLEHNPFEAGFAKVVKLEREEDFVGKSALQRLSETPVSRRLVSLVGEGKRAARQGYEIFEAGSDKAIGVITSGALSPTLGYPVAMAYVDTSVSTEVGAKLEVDIRGTRQEFTVSAAPFYKRSK
jgi:aminomethyltransferase